MFPIEIFNIISLYCKPYLFSVNKELSSLYNDDWFQTKLQNMFPNKKLFTTTNYKDLYKKYLLEGDIYCTFNVLGTYLGEKRQVKFKTKGIKAQYISCFNIDEEGNEHILTFNGELYHEKNNKVVLTDTEVVDISSNIYIKQNECISYFGDKYRLVDIETNYNFKQVIYENGSIWILTGDGLILREGNVTFYPFKNCVKMFMDDIIHIIDKDNNIYELEYGIFHIKPNYIYKIDIDNNKFNDDDYGLSSRCYYIKK